MAALSKLILGSIFILYLSGCGISTRDVVNLRQTRNELKRVNSELEDNLQVSLWGIKSNPNADVREEFLKIAFDISGEPSFDEKNFAEHATLKDARSLKKETLLFTKSKIRLQNKLIDIEDDIIQGHDQDNSLIKVILIGGSIILFLFIGVIGVFYIKSYLP